MRKRLMDQSRRAERTETGKERIGLLRRPGLWLAHADQRPVASQVPGECTREETPQGQGHEILTPRRRVWGMGELVIS